MTDWDFTAYGPELRAVGALWFFATWALPDLM